MPETSRSFHYWQPAPRWRLPLWLTNPGNPAMSPHTGKGRREGVGKTAWTMSCYPSRCCKFMLESHARMPQPKGTWKSDVCTCAKTVDYKRMLMLLVVNSVKLHLTALNAIKQLECETTQHQKNIHYLPQGLSYWENTYLRGSLQSRKFKSKQTGFSMTVNFFHMQLLMKL